MKSIWSTQDILIDQAGKLEKFQWFVRAHLESAGGKLAHEGSSTEKGCREQRALKFLITWVLLRRPSMLTLRCLTVEVLDPVFPHRYWGRGC